jgi:hypothetical protein
VRFSPKYVLICTVVSRTTASMDRVERVRARQVECGSRARQRRKAATAGTDHASTSAGRDSGKTATTYRSIQ